ncbi:neural Wiskott-Aldrich syndrome protein [Cephus cinctus]|uniref:Neural Wiskott-Aldrich syndrome protein n=1 Tax=Cephus cinctus TaxID=211228 RepID=A0AAJ7REC7_CEPCN|nr:neural Wiskott-Aldrich syndrome protein [Cephus cinctus]XP_015592178.1 neural Wiskott-Aldrich syndrome protein [Cephus cinctus]XP_024939338.1 neural Wiskott-Aldrich syndrome protein [Cephus cinctus]XP_024939339.1 neural Wiskott-Aldrich syndrome protein [Cephus cinctus]
MKSGSRNENRGSVVLKPEENEQVYGLIGNRCQCLAAGVIQLYVTEPPLHREWIKRNTGIITFIRDNPKHSFFLRLYCLQKKAMLWEHELYSPMDYKSPTSYFHTFEGEDCMTAFNFADETDALILRSVVLEKLNTKRQRRQERRSRMEVDSQHGVTLPRMSQSNTSTFGFSQVSTSTNLLNGSPSATGVNRSISSSSMYKTKKTKWKKDTKRRLTAADISSPSNFRHVAHMGWREENKSLETEAETLDPDLKQFFNKVGVSETQLRDPETRDFIYDFIENRGNMKVFEEVSGHSSTVQSRNQAATPQELGAPPPIPVRTVPVSPNIQTNSYPTRNAPPPPPPRTNLPPPPRSVPPVHRPLPSRPQAPLPSSVSSISSTPPSPPTAPTTHSLPTLPPPPPPPPPSRGTSIAAAPPPPPPPPLPSFNEFDAENVNSTNSTNNNNNNNGDCPEPMAMLMQSIRSGTTLRKVNKNEEKPPLEEDPRDDLLNQIRRGIELKPVTNIPEKPRPFLNLHDGLADALSRALAERARVIHSDSEYSTSDTSDDDEWDD